MIRMFIGRDWNELEISINEFIKDKKDIEDFEIIRSYFEEGIVGLFYVLIKFE